MLNDLELPELQVLEALSTRFILELKLINYENISIV